MKNLFFLIFTVLFLSTAGCKSVSINKYDVKANTNASLCALVYNSEASVEKKRVAIDELIARDIDWRSDRCEKLATGI